ncbi:MAG: type II methionyl aminopeptidase [Nitrososphaerota archaeon]|nr:type II methionyl aminopeptidase [Nitrososphaerota archaeon]
MTPAEAYQKAGRIAAQTLARTEVREGMSVLEICEGVEESIRRLGGSPAFPCNVSQDAEAAHYTASVADTKKIAQGASVKVDIGVHVDGYIADTATSFVFSQSEQRMASSNRQVLMDALKVVKAGNRVASLGDVVEPAALRLGYRPISNLAGHQMDRFVLHAGVSVPNCREAAPATFKEGAAYAVEPFFVPREASGLVANGAGGNIYRLITRKRTKDGRLDEVLDRIWERFRSLPFSPRWLAEDTDDAEALDELVRRRLVMEYPMLVESGGARVTQFEHTVYLEAGRAFITTLSA